MSPNHRKRTARVGGHCITFSKAASIRKIHPSAQPLIQPNQRNKGPLGRNQKAHIPNTNRQENNHYPAPACFPNDLTHCNHSYQYHSPIGPCNPTKPSNINKKKSSNPKIRFPKVPAWHSIGCLLRFPYGARSSAHGEPQSDAGQGVGAHAGLEIHRPIDRMSCRENSRITST